MNANTPSEIQKLVSAEEWQLRVDLAACYRSEEHTSELQSP